MLRKKYHVKDSSWMVTVKKKTTGREPCKTISNLHRHGRSLAGTNPNLDTVGPLDFRYLDFRLGS